MRNNQHPNKPPKHSFGERIVAYTVIAVILLIVYYFFKSGAWTFFVPVR